MQLETVELEGQRESTKARIFARWRGEAHYGDELTLFGKAEPIEPPRNPGEFDWRSYLARQDIHRSIFGRYAEQGRITRHQGGNFVLHAAQKARKWMHSAMTRGLEDEPAAGQLIAGIALGIRHETPGDIEELFQKTGTFHLFAVSGLNVAIIATLLMVLGTLLRLPRSWIVAFIIPALAFYATVTGLQTSSVRAAVMTSAVLAGFFAERKVLPLNTLAAAAFLILSWDTNQFFSVGFQLSFAVVFAILFWAEPFYRLLKRIGAADPLLPRILRGRIRRGMDVFLDWLWRGASVSLAAWLGSLPLIYWNFHLVTPISLLANLIVVPIAFFVLAIAMMSLLCAPVLPWLTVVFNHANATAAHLLLGTVNLFAQVPAGHFYLERPHRGSSATEITVLDSGAGGAAHLRVPGIDWLFDCGSERDHEYLLRPYLQSRGVNRLDGLLLTHGDTLHIGGALDVLRTCFPRVVIDNPLGDRSRVHRRLRTAFPSLGLQPRTPAAGESVSLRRDLVAHVLFPSRTAGAARTDDQALVIQLVSTFTPFRVLFMSDSGEATEGALLDRGIDLRSDILIKGQHSSGNSGSAAFLDAVRPKLIVASSRDFPSSERLNDEWVEQVRARGIKLFRQDETGAVILRLGADEWEARAYLTGEIFRSTSR
jgi:ComEC/Rec2-related protein